MRPCLTCKHSFVSGAICRKGQYKIHESSSEYKKYEKEVEVAKK